MLKLLLKVLAAYSKMLEERETLRKKPLRKKELVLYYLRGSQPIHIAKGVKIRKFSVAKACPGEKAKNAAGKPFAENTRCVTHFSNQPSQQKPRIEISLYRKNLWRTLLSDGMDLLDTYRRLTRFWII